MTALRRHFATGDELCAYVREVSGDTVLLSFSRGKDAIAALHQVRRFFGRIIPFHLDQLPEPLRLETEDLARWEDLLGVEVIRYVHPGTVRMLRNLVYQSPATWPTIRAMDLPASYTYEAIERHLRRRVGAPGAFIAVGSRAADSMVRRTNIKTNGSLTPARRMFFPVFDWDIADVERGVRELGLPLPDDYKMFGRTIEVPGADFMMPLREMYPDDYERVLKWFPLADLDIHRMTLRTGRAA